MVGNEYVGTEKQVPLFHLNGRERKGEQNKENVILYKKKEFVLRTYASTCLSLCLIC